MELLAKGAIAAGFAALALVFAPLASADSVTYLDALADDGIVVTDAGDAINTGMVICQAIGEGYSIVDVAAAVQEAIPSLTDHQAGFVVGDAMKNLCANTKS